MRIGLNLLHALPEIGGGYNYIARFVTALGEQDSENVYFAFITEATRSLVPSLSNWKAIDCAVDSRSRLHRVAYEMTRLQQLVRRHRLDCVHWFARLAFPWR